MIQTTRENFRLDNNKFRLVKYSKNKSNQQLQGVQAIFWDKCQHLGNGRFEH